MFCRHSRDLFCSVVSLSVHTLKLLLSTLPFSAVLKIVKPFAKNVFPIEGQSAAVTCIAYDDQNVTKPIKIDFMRGDNYGGYKKLEQGPRVAFKSSTECEYYSSSDHIFNTVLVMAYSCSNFPE